MPYRYYNRHKVTLSDKLCPTCKKVRLTQEEARKGYQCPSCTRLDEQEF